MIRRLGLTPLAVFTAAAALTAALALPARHELHVAVLVAFVVAYALADEVRLMLPVSGFYALAVQIVVVPMLFVLPVGLVPLAVLAGMLLHQAFRRRPTVRPWPALLLEDGLYVLPPAIIIALADPAPAWSDAPVLAAAFGAQFALDAGVSFVRYRAGTGADAAVAVRSVLTGPFLLDALLTPLALMATAQLREQPVGGALLLFVLLGLVWLLAHERDQRLVREEEALHDPLTGLPNRRLFDVAAASAVHGAMRANGSAAVLVIDLDGFKAVNDRYGHAAGDRLLETVAGRMRDALRASDTVARLGGDEFGVVLPGADFDAALHTAQRIQAVFDDPPEVDGVRCVIGASVGLAIFPADGSAPEDLVGAADAAMYAAKQRAPG